MAHSEFKATHENESGLTLYLVHNVTEQSVISSEITDETTHESTLFETGSWLSGRLFLLDRGFFKFRRFALIDENDGFFVSRLKASSNPVVTEELQEWPGRAIHLRENESTTWLEICIENTSMLKSKFPSSDECTMG